MRSLVGLSADISELRTVENVIAIWFYIKHIVIFFWMVALVFPKLARHPKSVFFSDSVPISRIMLRCIYGCQKWIPDKILHRNDDPTFFSTFIFSLKKIILKMKNIFFSKFSNLSNFWFFNKKNVFSFPINFFQRKK